jgi:RNA polymerase sigma factor (sigma-70 family)
MEDAALLVNRACGGDVEAYTELVVRFQDMAYGYAYSILGDGHLAQDATQEAFLEAYRDLDKLRQPAAFAGWLRRIVLKRCDRIIRSRQLPRASVKAADAVPADEAGPAEAAEKRELSQRVREAIQSLSEHERTATTLFYIDGYSQDEIADFLEVPVTTVKNRLHTSRRRLRERMIAMLGDELKSHKPGPEFPYQLFRGINLLDKWWISPKSVHHQILGRGILVHDAEAHGLHAEVGGPSWDNYRVGLDVLAETDTSKGKFPWNVQLCPHDSGVYCQLFGKPWNGFTVGYWAMDREPHHTNIAYSPRPAPLGIWHRFELEVAAGVAELYLNQHPPLECTIPTGTRGMLGLMVNISSDARVRLRNMQITFLKPTREQLRELERDATANWEEFEQQQARSCQPIDEQNMRPGRTGRLGPLGSRGDHPTIDRA